MKLSIIYPVLNSHEVLRRQFLHLEKIGLPDETEIIIVDDGSEPPLEYHGDLPIRIIQTNDKRKWTWALARNRGVEEAKGVNILMTDIDHILPRESLDICADFVGDKVYFWRWFGVLDENGNFTQDPETMFKYGLSRDYYKRHKLKIGSLPNNICIKKTTFYEMGRYREDRIGKPYPQGEDRSFKKAYRKWERERGRPPITVGTPIYMFPNGYFCGDVDFNPFDLFHNLSRVSHRNQKHKTKQNKAEYY